MDDPDDWDPWNVEEPEDGIEYHDQEAEDWCNATGRRTPATASTISGADSMPTLLDSSDDEGEDGEVRRPVAAELAGQAHMHRSEHVV